MARSRTAYILARYPSGKPEKMFTNKAKVWRWLRKTFHTLERFTPDQSMPGGVRIEHTVATYARLYKLLRGGPVHLRLQAHEFTVHFTLSTCAIE